MENKEEEFTKVKNEILKLDLKQLIEMNKIIIDIIKYELLGKKVI